MFAVGDQLHVVTGGNALVAGAHELCIRVRDRSLAGLLFILFLLRLQPLDLGHGAFQLDDSLAGRSFAGGGAPALILLVLFLLLELFQVPARYCQMFPDLGLARETLLIHAGAYFSAVHGHLFQGD